MPTIYIAPEEDFSQNLYNGGILGMAQFYFPAAVVLGDGTRINPVTVRRAVDVLNATELIALPGVYKGANNMLIDLPDNIVVTGYIAGEQTLFDGQQSHPTVRAPAGGTFGYIQACNAVDGIVATRANDSHFEFCEFWNDGPFYAGAMGGNAFLFYASGVTNATSNEVSLFGYGRKMLFTDRSQNVDDNHLWIRHDWAPPDATDVITASPHSSSFYVTLRNSIISVGGTDDPRQRSLGMLSVQADVLASETVDPGAPRSSIDIRNVLVYYPETVNDPYDTIPSDYIVGYNHHFYVNNVVHLKAAETRIRNLHVVSQPTTTFYLERESEALSGSIDSDSYVSRADLLIESPWTGEPVKGGIYSKNWPTLTDEQWTRIKRATDMSGYPKGFTPDELILNVTTRSRIPVPASRRMELPLLKRSEDC